MSNYQERILPPGEYDYSIFMREFSFPLMITNSITLSNPIQYNELAITLLNNNYLTDYPHYIVSILPIELSRKTVIKTNKPTFLGKNQARQEK